MQLLFVSSDRTPEDMAAYMKDDDMPWWGVRMGSPSERLLARSYAHNGIPCLVLLDRDGVVLADSYVDGRYVGPESVLSAYGQLVK